jgi:hypothetical protein
MPESVREPTNPFIYVDGDASLFPTARNFVEHTKFADRLSVPRPEARRQPHDIIGRRRRLASIQNEIKQ